MAESERVTLFLGGDVMVGRGIDQILPHPSAPQLFEHYVTSAITYLDLAEQAHGSIPKRVDWRYVWGDALSVLERQAPSVRIVNLETAITVSNDAMPEKGIHYRMHPSNIEVLSVAGIDCCVLANNHVIDWGYSGLSETLRTLHAAGISTAGAGNDLDQAAAPAVLLPKANQRVLVFGYGVPTSGIREEWAARSDRAGVNFLNECTPQAADAMVREIARVKRHGDIAVVSIHWGDNWGYQVSAKERAFAHRLIQSGAVDLIHGHSSHHPKAIEFVEGKPILYGCGDLLNDYEGIGGHQSFRADLSLMYFATFDNQNQQPVQLILVPLRIRKFRLNQASRDDAAWLEATMNRECKIFGSRAERMPDGLFRVFANP